MFFDAECYKDNLAEITPRISANCKLVLNLAYLVDMGLADSYKTAIGGITEAADAENACESARYFTSALEERNYDRHVIQCVSDALHWYIGCRFR